ncbi:MULTISPECIES: ABC transporter substrate-binding protein [unclassified Vibrio]|uniref:ABC transporter substrate-binding protein n=1 Tax=Vibrio sp. HB236076 TaxID=3232307 RepID=A0AB39HHV0_9VIBR|nr:ABC transporter substrate-binding protein [Vibrio sp. HB161653]MDP5255003.1 ABC transporter substrate-binding protein [Vibrio sp. HB161653]
MSLDWAQTQTLLALGIVPAAAAKVDDYKQWVGYPAIPEQTVDIGLRSQPNIERLIELDLDTIYLSSRFLSLRTQLERIAKVRVLTARQEGKVNWQTVRNFTLAMAQDLGLTAKAQQLIVNSEQRLSRLANRLSNNRSAVLLVQFMDRKHVRVYGENSAYQIALNKLAVKNAWQKESNYWGYTLVGIEQLQGIHGQIIVIDPLPIGVSAQLERDPYWQYIIRTTGHSMLSLPATWSVGSIPSVMRFAEQLTRALTQENKVWENTNE